MLIISLLQCDRLSSGLLRYGSSPDFDSQNELGKENLCLTMYFSLHSILPFMTGSPSCRLDTSFLPPHLMVVLPREDALLLSFGQVMQQQECIAWHAVKVKALAACANLLS